MDKLSYKLDVFEGPLDLLLTLIAKNKLNIYDINISQLLEQYMEQISVASLATQVHLTPTYLCVLFKQATGKTINEYLTNERIRHAKRLLRDPAVRLYDICYRVGYLSPSYFSKLFKKQTGMPPGEYRFQAQNETLTKG